MEITLNGRRKDTRSRQDRTCLIALTVAIEGLELHSEQLYSLGIRKTINAWSMKAASAVVDTRLDLVEVEVTLSRG